MAEFVEVMRQAKRMCKSYRNDCAGCGLAHDASECPLEALPEDWPVESHRLAGIERIVMDWAAAHPEPRYPSWNEAWKQLFPDAKCIPCPVNHFGVGRKCEHNCVECKNRPMTADIAEKLGIKPIGDAIDA